MPTYLFKIETFCWQQLCHSSRWCIISEVCESCVLSTKFYRHSTNIWYGHHKMFQVVVQEPSSTGRCVHDGLRKGHWPESSVLQVMHFTLAAWWQAFLEDGFPLILWKALTCVPLHLHIACDMQHFWDQWVVW
jgi:hypothetical protein